MSSDILGYTKVGQAWAALGVAFAGPALAQPKDIVVIAGKGHETYQVLRDRTIDFDDRDVARRALRRRGPSPSVPDTVTDRVLIIDDGKIIYDGPISAIRDRFGKYREITFETGNLPTAPALMGNTVLWKPASIASRCAAGRVRSMRHSLVFPPRRKTWMPISSIGL